MKVKIIFLIGLIIMVMIGSLVSCTSSNNTATEDNHPAVTTSAEAELTTEKPVLPENPEPEWEKDGVLRILTIGNSFSDDTMEYVYQIAKDAGVDKIELGNLYIGGCTLDTHVSNAKSDKAAYEYRTNTRGKWTTTANYKMSDALSSKKWDFISMQQASGSSGVKTTYNNLDYLIDYVRENSNPEAVLVWNMTWAYQQDSTHSEFPKYGSSQKKMYNSIISAVADKVDSKSEISIVSPTGTAIQNARTSYVGDHLTRDGFHLSYDLGRYIAGLTFFHALTGKPIDDVVFAPDTLDEDLKEIAIESAINAVKNPREITESVYTKAPDLPELDESKYTKLVIDWTPLGYWNSTDANRPHQVITNASNSKQFYASPLFTQEDIPVGSIIVLSEGWQYRPEAWKTNGTQSGRPVNVTTLRVVVTEKWWGSYKERAFNLSKQGLPDLTNLGEEALGALTIYVPKNND